MLKIKAAALAEESFRGESVGKNGQISIVQ
jgi:hypothetical protein